jgi:drug/metabolite transporter (DMT)-like permease
VLIPAKAAFFCSLYVLVVPFLDRLTGVALAREQVWGACLSVFGVALLSSEDGSVAFSVGDLLSLIQPLAFGIGYWRTEHALRRFPMEANRIAAAEIFACFLLSLAYAVVSCSIEDNIPTTIQFLAWLLNPNIVIALLWTGVITSAVAVYLETEAMKIIAATETTLLSSIEPLWASLFAWVLVGEKIDSTGVIGGVLVVSACAVSMSS